MATHQSSRAAVNGNIVPFRCVAYLYRLHAVAYTQIG